MNAAHLTSILELARLEQAGWHDRLKQLHESGEPLNAMTLVESAKLSRDNLQRGVLQTFVITSAVLDRIPMLEIEGNAYAYNVEATLPGVEFRAVNAAYTESTGTVNQATEKLVILGGDADVDEFIQRTRSDLNDQRAVQTALKVKAINYKYQDAFINGDTAVDANSFDGLKKRLTGGQVITAGANGLAIIGADSAARHAFLDKVDELIATVPGLTGDNGALYMNDLVKAKLMGSARRRFRQDDRPLPRHPAHRRREQGGRDAHHPADRDPGRELGRLEHLRGQVRPGRGGPRRHDALQRARGRVRRPRPRRVADQAERASPDRGVRRHGAIRRQGRRPFAGSPSLVRRGLVNENE
jgi:hypothetical protein